ISGIDFSGDADPGSMPRHMGTFAVDGAPVNPGTAFCFPIAPGATEACAAFMEELYGTRAAELAEAWAAKGYTREEAFLLQTPMGDCVVVYSEAEDPEAADNAVASGQTPFDRWFKDNLRILLPPDRDPDQPIPRNQQIWDYVA